MAYTTNPHIERVRMEAVRMVLQGTSTVQVARHFGFSQSTIVKWVQRAQRLPSNAHCIPTRSSRPHHHPDELSQDVIDRILALRAERNQCAEILHWRLTQEGVFVSLSSVKRVLKRCGLTRFSKWKKWHQYPERPLPEKPGILVEIDTIHSGASDRKLYVYTLLDVCSRWAHAMPVPRINTHRSLRFVEEAQGYAPFPFQTLQSDHGPEFSKWLTLRASERDMDHRHSRVRTPTDNGHLERFNRTIQQECLRRIPRTLRSWEKEIPEYLRYYNTERPHMGLGMKTPHEVIKTIPSY
ncbi:DDE-type integrase/transposase/recombinase [Candidatus Azambacteria bacterium]|nr:DDE-type integrase/transposase/recombinase [Candidatus Azambacteria bacterium]